LNAVPIAAPGSVRQKAAILERLIIQLPRYAHLWLPGYLRSRATQRKRPKSGRVWVAIADHWEPYWKRPSDETARERVAAWVKHWPEIARQHVDSTGQPPQYTFYYPQDEYRPEFLESLAGLVRAGIADVDVHIHHNGEGEQNFVDRMSGFIEALVSRHGLLRQWQGRTVFGFIHGNWALDNSRPDGQWCGLNNEITLLGKLGCYADFTMPSGNSPTQARKVNSIYWVTDDPQQPRSYDRGVEVKKGFPGSGDLLMIPGPFGLRWTRPVPRIETGQLAYHDLPTRYRVKRWLELAPHIGDDIFIKLYGHGTQERNSSALLLNGGLDRLFTLLAEECRLRQYQLRYVSTWEMRKAVDLACMGNEGSQSEPRLQERNGTLEGL
jgi:hypothetical protein